MTKALTTLADLTPDAANANRGTVRGRAMPEHSLRTYGAGRSVLPDTTRWKIGNVYRDRLAGVRATPPLLAGVA